MRRGVDAGQGRGGTVSFDPNIRKETAGAARACAATLDDVLAVTDLFLPSGPDLPSLSRRRTRTRRVRGAARPRRRQIVLLKKGAEGSVYYDADRRIAMPAFPAEEVDPTGAGDCFGGDLRRLPGAAAMPLARGAALANAAGALAVGKKGPMEGNSTMAELEAFLAARGAA